MRRLLALAVSLVVALVPAAPQAWAASGLAAPAAQALGGKGVPEEPVPGMEPTPTSSGAVPPGPLPAQALRLPEPAEATLANGLRVVVVPQRTLPIFTAQLVFPGGESAVPATRAGLSGITAQLLTRGTESRSAQDIAGTVEQSGSQLSASASLDAVTISANGLVENLDTALDIMGDVARHPTFPAADLAVLQQQALTGLRSDLSEPDVVADRVFRAVVYGAHPYGQSATADSLRAITRDDVTAFYSAQFHPDGALLVLVGDLDPTDAMARAQQVFGDWAPVGSQGSPSSVVPPASTNRAIYLVDRPGSTQAAVQLGHVLPRPLGPDRFAAEVANKVLGVGSTSRLFLNLREEKGFTYDIFSTFSASRGPARFSVSAAVRTDVAGQALREILAELQRLRLAAVPADELAAARSFLVGSYALRLETADAIAARVVSLSLRGFPLSNVADYPSLIDGIDAAAVQRVAQQFILPDQVAIVVVGDANRLRPALEAIAPVTLVDAQGQPRTTP